MFNLLVPLWDNLSLFVVSSPRPISLCQPVLLHLQLIALLNFSVLGFSFAFHDKAKRTQQGNLLPHPLPHLSIDNFSKTFLQYFFFFCSYVYQTNFILDPTWHRVFIDSFWKRVLQQMNTLVCYASSSVS